VAKSPDTRPLIGGWPARSLSLSLSSFQAFQILIFFPVLFLFLFRFFSSLTPFLSSSASVPPSSTHSFFPLSHPACSDPPPPALALPADRRSARLADSSHSLLSVLVLDLPISPIPLPVHVEFLVSVLVALPSITQVLVPLENGPPGIPYLGGSARCPRRRCPRQPQQPR
jgi:hypothetical protein